MLDSGLVVVKLFVCFFLTVIREEPHNCQMVDFFFSWMGGLSLDALKGKSGVSQKTSNSDCFLSHISQI